jgi:peptidoglycan/LPS O-acetylase OafA/YrhL
VLVAFTDQYRWWNALLLNHVFGPPHWTESWTFWFVEVLVTILVGLALLLAVPAVRRLERRHRTLLPALAFVVGWLLRPDVLGPTEATMRYGPLLVFWLFALGWLIQVSPGLRGRLLVTVLVLASLPGYFPGEPVRGWVVQAGLLLLTWLPVLPLPRLLTPVVHRVAAASLWIYLTHWVVWPVLLDAGLSHPATVLGCLVVGVAAAAVVARLQVGGTRLVEAGAARLSAVGLRRLWPASAPPRPVL